jgi:hypothetical protein
MGFKMNLQLFGGRGGSSGMGGGGNLSEFIADWQAMGRVDMGSSINDMVTEVNAMIGDITGYFEHGDKWGYSEFYKSGELIRYLNGYQASTGDYDSMHLNQTLDLHSVGFTEKGLTKFLNFLDKGRFNGYGDYAREELSKMNTKGRRKRR